MYVQSKKPVSKSAIAIVIVTIQQDVIFVEQCSIVHILYFQGNGRSVLWREACHGG